MEGIGAIEGDNSFSGELFVSQQERAFLENLQSSRKTGPESKTISISELENKLEKIAQVKGEEGLNQIRDNAKVIAEKLGMQKEFEKLNKLISALLSTQPSKILSSPRAIARAFGNPYDQSRIDLFEILFIELKQREFKNVIDKNTSNTAFKNFAFFESYFSNYIEGTRFEVEEAKNIIETDTPMFNRDEDSHDILGTYKLVSSKVEMNITPSKPEEFVDILQYRHRLLLEARTSKMPGVFKDKNNKGLNAEKFKLLREALTEDFSRENVIKTVNQLAFKQAADVGNMIDELIKDFLTREGTGFKAITKPEKMSQKAFDALFGTNGVITSFRDSVIDGDYMIVGASDMVFDKSLFENRLVGETDLIAVDGTGNFNIIDVNALLAGSWKKFNADVELEALKDKLAKEGVSEEDTAKNKDVIDLEKAKRRFIWHYGIGFTT